MLGRGSGGSADAIVGSTDLNKGTHVGFTTTSARCCALVMAVALLPLTGCMTLVKQAYYEIKGAQAKIVLNEDMTDRTLLNYKGVKFEPLKRAVGERIVPQTFVTAFDHATAETLADLKEEYPGGEPTLTVKTEVSYFQRKGFLSSALSLTRMHVLAGERLVVDAMVLAETKAFREGDGDEALAEATVKAISKMLATRKNPETYDEKDEKEQKEREKKAKKEQKEQKE